MAVAEATRTSIERTGRSIPVIQRWLKVEDPAVARAAYDYYAPITSVDMQISEKSLAVVFEKLPEAQKKGPKLSDVTDLSLLAGLEKEGFFAKLKCARAAGTGRPPDAAWARRAAVDRRLPPDDRARLGGSRPARIDHRTPSCPRPARSSRRPCRSTRAVMILEHLTASGSAFVIGLALAIGVGMPMGVAIGWSARLDAVLAPYLAALLRRAPSWPCFRL